MESELGRCLAPGFGNSLAVRYLATQSHPPNV